MIVLSCDAKGCGAKQLVEVNGINDTNKGRTFAVMALNGDLPDILPFSGWLLCEEHREQLVRETDELRSAHIEQFGVPPHARWLKETQ